MPPATPQPAAEGGGAAIAAIGLVVGLLVIIGVVVKVFDLKQKRESEAVQLQAQLSDALLREPSLAGLPLTPTVHVPMWKGTPATIEMMGRVPTPEVKDAVLRIVRDEAARVRSDVQINAENRVLHLGSRHSSHHLEVKDAVLRIVRDEAARVRSDVQIEERLSVVPTMARVA